MSDGVWLLILAWRGNPQDYSKTEPEFDRPGLFPHTPFLTRKLVLFYYKATFPVI